jgi:hypothetical protein
MHKFNLTHRPRLASLLLLMGTLALSWSIAHQAGADTAAFSTLQSSPPTPIPHPVRMLLPLIQLGPGAPPPPTATATPTAAASPAATETPTPTQTPTAAPTPTVTSTPTAQPGCHELIVNGDMEASTGWVMPVTAHSAGYATAQAHSPTRSLRAGIDSGRNVYSYSGAWQAIDVPAQGSATASVWIYTQSTETQQAAMVGPWADQNQLRDALLGLQRAPDGAAPQAGDSQYMFIQDANGNHLATVFWNLTNNRQWRRLEINLGAYAGRRIRLYFGAYNDGAGGVTALYVDDVSVQHCGVEAPTKWFDVDLSEQRLRAYEGNTIVRTTLVSTGTAEHPTPTGQFRIYIKLRYDDMSGPGYYLPDVPFVMYFYQGYAIHGTYWHSNFGYPMSHGCVNLATAEAEWAYNWAPLGTLVNIHP